MSPVPVQTPPLGGLQIPDPVNAWVVELDPDEIAVDRSELDINDPAGRISISQAGVDWGDAAIQEFLADQAVGSTLVDYRLPNRTVTINLNVGDGNEANYLASKAALQQKVALIQREGGWLKRDTGVPLYADVVNATLTFPDHWGAVAFMEDGVKLVLECVPDFYGDEVTLDVISGTGYVSSVLQQASAQAVITGDHPGRCRIIVADTSGNAQKGLVWGLRSRYYDSASTAALTYNAAAMTPVNGSAVTASAGAYSGNFVAVTPQPNTWHSFLITDLVSGGQLTHRGSYAVWARCTTDTAGMQLRLSWSLDDTTAPEYNDPVTLPVAGYGTAYTLEQFGVIRADVPPVGAHWWRGVVQAFAGDHAASHVAIDKMWLVPLDESSGIASATQTPPSFALTASAAPSAAGNDASVGTVAWSNPGNIFSEDSAYATVTVPSGGQSEYLTGTGFGFAIPVGATITGIVAQFAHRAQDPATAPALMKAGAVVGGAAAGYSTSLFAGDLVEVYGGASDLWGLSWSPADINAAGFGAALTAINTGPFANVAHVNQVVIAVYYTTGGGFTVAEDAVINASRVAEVRTEGVFREDTASTAYVTVGDTTGDLPRIPPSGLEGRPVELLVKPSRGDLQSRPDGGIDTSTVQVEYRASYLFPA